jgi:two-component system response regulator GlrR
MRLVGRSPQHSAVLATLDKVAPSDAEVLITGPSGVGKELYARYVHDQSRRCGAEFVAINCAALSTDLLENELFGHVGGAFTGARAQRQGLVAEAEGGTLFFDEIDTLSPPSQVKLLRFIQMKEYRRLGESRVRHADVRIVAASNADLQAAVFEGHFRADLFFRLRVVPVHVPPLSERRDDIELLLAEFVDRYAREYDTVPIVFSDAARRRLALYDWPGNIRELENCVRYLTCLHLARPIEAHELPLLPGAAEAVEVQLCSGTFREEKRILVDRFERAYLEEALRKANGNIAHAAMISAKPRRAFFELLRKHRIDSNGFRPSGTARRSG